MVGSLLAPILVLTVLIWNTDAEHLKSRAHGKTERMNLAGLKNLRREARGKAHSPRRHNFMGKHSALMIDQDAVSNKKHMEFTYEKQCGVECQRHEVCVKHTATGSTKCVHKKLLKESHRLSKFNKHHKKGGKRHNRLMREFGHHQKFNRLESRVNELDERPQNIRRKQLMAMKKAKKHNRKFISKHKLIENMDAIDELMHLGEGSQSEISRKYPECVSKVEGIRQRLNGWFVMLHTQKKEHRSKKYKLNHSQLRKPKHYGDFRTFGQCKCSASVMWERRSLDKDEDTFLSVAELAILEGNRQEKCITPLLESCDTDKDKLLSKKEWCCCFTDTEAPCFKHLEKVKEGQNYEGYKPTCTTEGFYEKTQCDPTGMYCWCSDLDGNQIANTKIQGNPHCERFDTTGRPVEL